MKQLGEQLAETVRVTEAQLRQLSETQAEHSDLPGAWTKKELLGHLIDSASNNHQRFVRLQLANDLKLPKYEQEGWVRVQDYQRTEWALLIDLWRSYNLHLARLISNVDPEALAHTGTVGDGGPVTLQFLMEDYVEHLEHHLTQLLKPL